MDENPFEIAENDDPILAEDAYDNLRMEKVWKFLFENQDLNFFIHFDQGLDYDEQKKCAEFILSCIQQVRNMNQAQINIVRERADNDVREVLAMFVGIVKKIADYFPDIVVASESSDNEDTDTLEEQG